MSTRQTLPCINMQHRDMSAHIQSYQAAANAPLAEASGHLEP